MIIVGKAAHELPLLRRLVDQIKLDALGPLLATLNNVTDREQIVTRLARELDRTLVRGKSIPRGGVQVFVIGRALRATGLLNVVVAGGAAEFAVEEFELEAAFPA